MNEKFKSKKISGEEMDFTITPPRLKSKRRISSLFLKSLACITGPLTVPAVVYGVEGCTTPFWWLLGVSSVTSLLLLTIDIQKVQDLIEYLKINRHSRIRCLIKVGLLLLMCGGCVYAYHIHFDELFNVCLFVTGVITGTLFTDITSWWNFRRNKNLPYVNFPKNSPIPTHLELGRKSLDVPSCAANLLPLKRQLSSPTKKSSDSINRPMLDEMKSVPLSDRRLGEFTSPVYSSSNSSSSESDGPDAPPQISITTPIKRKVISAGMISLSPLAITPKTDSKRKLELLGPPMPSNISYMETPTFTYTECGVENLLSQNFNLFHM